MAAAQPLLPLREEQPSLEVESPKQVALALSPGRPEGDAPFSPLPPFPIPSSPTEGPSSRAPPEAAASLPEDVDVDYAEPPSLRRGDDGTPGIQRRPARMIAQNVSDSSDAEDSSQGSPAALEDDEAQPEAGHGAGPSAPVSSGRSPLQSTRTLPARTPNPSTRASAAMPLTGPRKALKPLGKGQKGLDPGHSVRLPSHSARGPKSAW